MRLQPLGEGVIGGLSASYSIDRCLACFPVEHVWHLGMHDAATKPIIPIPISYHIILIFSTTGVHLHQTLFI